MMSTRQRKAVGLGVSAATLIVVFGAGAAWRSEVARNDAQDREIKRVELQAFDRDTSIARQLREGRDITNARLKEICIAVRAGCQ
ncbi:MAG TPA: hypothetical protein VFN76_10040 [Candidatus Limnocylindria bacterium]|nr:hypothetical protein [Candidatus Limnocylindria bacterium]